MEDYEGDAKRVGEANTAQWIQDLVKDAPSSFSDVQAEVVELEACFERFRQRICAIGLA